MGVSHGTKLLARQVQGRSSITMSFLVLSSPHSPTTSQLSLLSSITAWAVWKLMKILQFWALILRPSAVCTRQVRLQEVYTATTDWEEILFWIAWFLDAW